MRLSARVSALKPSSTLAVEARVKALRAQGARVIGFGAGEPDFDTPEPFKEAAIEALRAGRTKYVATEGDFEARVAIAEKLRSENGITCGPEHIVISVGAKHSLYLALQCLLDPPAGPDAPAQEVVIPTPAWVSYRPMSELAGGRVVEVAGRLDRGFKITAEELEQALNPRTAVLILNSPSNPCGTMYSPDDLREFAEVLERHPQVVVITDEIYEKLIYTDVPHFSIGSLPSLAERTVTINGMSKAFAMTGWRVGYACAPGEGGKLAKAMAKLQGQMTSNITSFTYPAVIQAMRCGSASVETMRRRFAGRAELIYRAVSTMPGVRCPRPTGAFYVFPDVSAHFGKSAACGRRIESALGFAEALLEHAQVAVVPGEDFGQCARGHVRMSFACAEDEIEEGCRRMTQWIASLR